MTPGMMRPIVGRSYFFDGRLPLAISARSGLAHMHCSLPAVGHRISIRRNDIESQRASGQWALRMMDR